MMKKAFRTIHSKISRKFLPPLIAYIGYSLLRLILWTCKIEINGLDRFIYTAEKSKCILMLWHNRLALVPYFGSTLAPTLTYNAFISNSRDGEIIASLAKRFQQGKTTRVAHHARYNGLRELIRHLKTGQEVIVITPDGPRGPRYHVKKGIVFAAKATQAKIIPFTWSANRFWELSTWDKLMIPKPFSKIVFSIGETLEVAPTDESETTLNTLQLQNALDSL